jgi:ribosomal protein S18 acetylase RimI-like enzyme
MYGDMLLILRYQPEDNEAVKALHYAGLEQFDADAGIEADPFLDADLDEIENVYIRTRGEFLVGLCDEKIVAIGGLRKVTETRVEIKRMRVHPDYQRRGFGQEILEKLLDIAAGLGYQEICLNTTSPMTPAQKLYEKYGFVEERREKIGRQEVIFYDKQLL